MHLSRARALAPVMIAALVATSIRPAWSADEKKACVDAAESAQDLRSASKLRDAREKLLVCARDVCPPVVRKDCQQWLKDVEASIPTLVFRATKDGVDLVDVSVLVDGEDLVDKLDGKAVAVDPGQHRFEFYLGYGKPIAKTIVVHEAEKNRAIDVEFPSDEGTAADICKAQPSACPSMKSADTVPAAAEKKPPSGIPAGAVVLGAVGVVGLAGFAYFGLKGKSEIDDLRSSCAPGCNQDDVDAAKRKLLFADVSLAVGVVALGAATWILLGHHDAPSTTGALRVNVGAVPQGAFAGISGAF